MSRLLCLIAVSGLLLSAQTVPATPLTPQKEINARAEAGHPQRYLVSLEAGDFARIILFRRGDVEARLLTPEGAEVVKDEIVSHYGPFALFLTAATAGDYRLEVSAAEGSGAYSVTLAERRKAIAEDQLRIAAQAERARAFAAPLDGLPVLARAIELCRKAGEEQGLLESLLNSADLAYGSEDRSQGRAHGEEAVSIAARRQDGYAESEARFLLAKLLAGNASADAITQLEKAIEISTAINDANGLGKALNLTGSIYSTMGQRERALQYYSRSLPIFRDLGFKRWIASAQLSIGRTLNAMGRVDQAVKPLEEALEIYRGLGDKSNQALILDSMAEAAAAREQPDRAASLLEQALALHRETRSSRLIARSLSNLASVRGNTGDWHKAAALLTEALEIQKTLGAGIDTAQTRILLSRVENRQGDAARARKLAEEALTDLEGLAERTGGIEAQATYFAGFRSAYTALVDALRKAGDEAGAFQASERSRARALAAMIGARKIDIGASLDAGLRQRAAKLEQELAAKLKEQTALERRTHTREEAETLLRDIDGLRHQQDRLQAEIRKAHPNYASITQYTPIDVDRLRKHVLDDDTALVEYMAGLRRSYVWVVTREGVTSAELPPRAVIDKLAREGYQALTARNRQQPPADADADWEKKSAELSVMLLKPIEAALAKRRWLVVADETLHYIPFAALAPDREIVNLPSAAVLTMIRETAAGRKAPSKTLAVFADPVLEKDDPRLGGAKPAAAASQHRGGPDEKLRGQLVVSRLPFTRREAEAITASLPKNQVRLAAGFDASRAAATDAALADYRVLHFATHGILNEDAPELSGIVLSLFDSTGQPRDGFLRLHDIYNMKLPVDLVVLSACQTGLGKKMDGEGMIGLTRGMMFAGAARVVASLWKVDDAATAELMRLFYQSMLVEGKPAAEALHIAQKQMAAQRRWRSPYYWAAFQLHGEYR